MTTITIDRALLEQALASLQGYRRELNDGQPCDTEKALVAELAKQKLDPTGAELPTEQANQPDLTFQGQVPAWHDAPTCPGLWVLDDGTALVLESGTLPKAFDGLRWYGPICEDEAIAKAEGRTE